jgi:hypothetical protein
VPALEHGTSTGIRNPATGLPARANKNDIRSPGSCDLKPAMRCQASSSKIHRNLKSNNALLPEGVRERILKFSAFITVLIHERGRRTAQRGFADGEKSRYIAFPHSRPSKLTFSLFVSALSRQRTSSLAGIAHQLERDLGLSISSNSSLLLSFSTLLYFSLLSLLLYFLYCLHPVIDSFRLASSILSFGLSIFCCDHKQVGPCLTPGPRPLTSDPCPPTTAQEARHQIK